MSSEGPSHPRIVLTGAHGQLGRAVQRLAAPRGLAVFALARDDLDVTDRTAVADGVRRHRPTHIINAAAFTAVDDAEGRPERAYAVNRDGAAHLARAARELGAGLLHVSTDHVFSGVGSRPWAPGDLPDPVNVYGASKLAGEEAVMDITRGDALILRVGWLYSMDGRNFLTTMLRRMAECRAVRVVADQIGTPTRAATVARMLLLAIGANLRGIHHWADGGQASRYEFAQAIRDEAQARHLLPGEVTVEPIATGDYAAAARRPAFAVLDVTATLAHAGEPPLPWREALRDELERAEGRA